MFRMTNSAGLIEMIHGMPEVENSLIPPFFVYSLQIEIFECSNYIINYHLVKYLSRNLFATSVGRPMNIFVYTCMYIYIRVLAREAIAAWSKSGLKSERKMLER